MIQRIPPVVIKACKSVIILTYMFEGSFMESWLRLNCIPYEYTYPDSLESPTVLKDNLRNNLHLIVPPKAIEELQTNPRGESTPTTFSVSWYERMSKRDGVLQNVKKSVESTLKHNMRLGDTFWTTFVDYRKVMEGKGYTRGRRINGSVVSPFLSKNTRASNEYMHHNKCIYMVNSYPNVGLVNHLSTFGIEFDIDKYALSELIQFIFRGCIRQNKEMDLYILSNRMRGLLVDWLKEDR